VIAGVLFWGVGGVLIGYLAYRLALLL